VRLATVPVVPLDGSRNTISGAVRDAVRVLLFSTPPRSGSSPVKVVLSSPITAV
jgi:hypothetical protein